MNLSQNEINGITVVAVAGRVDSATARDLEAHLHTLVDAKKVNLVLDLNGVVHMSSEGLRTMVSTLKACHNENGDLCLCNPSRQVAEVLRLSGLASVFTIYDTPDAAVASFG